MPLLLRCRCCKTGFQMTFCEYLCSSDGDATAGGDDDCCFLRWKGRKRRGKSFAKRRQRNVKNIWIEWAILSFHVSHDADVPFLLPELLLFFCCATTLLMLPPFYRISSLLCRSYYYTPFTPALLQLIHSLTSVSSQVEVSIFIIILSTTFLLLLLPSSLYTTIILRRTHYSLHFYYRYPFPTTADA